MWQRRPLQRQSFARRVASWGLPLAWVVVFVQKLAPFLSQFTIGMLVALHTICVAVEGTTRDLELPRQARRGKSLKEKVSRAMLIGLNFVSDAACALCSVFFLQGVEIAPAPFFAPLLIVAVASHCVVEMRVDAMLNKLHGGGGQGFARRGFTAQEKEFEIESVTLID